MLAFHKREKGLSLSPLSLVHLHACVPKESEREAGEGERDETMKRVVVGVEEMTGAREEGIEESERRRRKMNRKDED